jgi:hypothetical protein
MNGVRLHHRLPVKLPVQITVTGETPMQYEGLLLDMSVHGLGLRTRQELKPGTQIEVTLDKFCFAGVVRHCKKQWKGYHSPYDNFRIGVLMHEPLDESDLDGIVSGSWKKSVFVPAPADPGTAARPHAM